MKRRAFNFGVLGLVGAATCGMCRPWENEGRDPMSLTGNTGRSLVPAGVTSDVWAVLRVRAEQGDCDDRPPIGVALLIDTSGSMEGDAIAGARAAATEVIESLQDDDLLVVVAFDSEARVVVEASRGDRDDALEQVGKMEARGTTNLAEGLRVALAQLQANMQPGTVNRVVLLSDGVPNDASMVGAYVSEARTLGVTITAFGFGLEYDETLLGSIAQNSGGSFHYIEDASDIAPMFAEENVRLQGVAAHGMWLNLVTGPNVTIAEVVGSPGFGGEQGAVSLGDLSRGQERIVAVRLSVAPHRDGANVELLDATLTYRDPQADEPDVRKSVYLAARATTDADAIEKSVDSSVAEEVARQRAAEQTLHAVAATRNGDVDLAKRTIQEALPAARAAAAAAPSPDLAEQVAEMEELVEVIDGEDSEPKKRELRNELHSRAMRRLQAH